MLKVIKVLPYLLAAIIYYVLVFITRKYALQIILKKITQYYQVTIKEGLNEEGWVIKSISKTPISKFKSLRIEILVLFLHILSWILPLALIASIGIFMDI